MYSAALNLTLQTGGGDDYLQAVGVAAHSLVLANLSAGDDTLVWAFARDGVNGTFDFGLGNDNLTQLLPLGGHVAASLGDNDEHSDILDVWWGDMSPPPNFDSSADGLAVLAPLSPTGGPSSRTVINHMTARDQPMLSPGYPDGWAPPAAATAAAAATMTSPTTTPTSSEWRAFVEGFAGSRVVPPPQPIASGAAATGVDSRMAMAADNANNAAADIQAALAAVHKDAALQYAIEGCDNAFEETRFTVQAGVADNVVVTVSNNGSVLDFGCSVRVTGAANATATVVVDASRDSDSDGDLMWKVDQGYLSVWSGTKWFNLFVEAVERVVMLVPAGSSNVQMFHGTAGTETLLHFSESSSSSSSSSTVSSSSAGSAVVQVWSTAAAVLINGSFASVGISPPKSPLSAVQPFANFGGTVAATHGLSLIHI